MLDPSTLSSMYNLARLYKQQGKSAAAEELYTEELAGMRKNHGDDHPDTLSSVRNLVRLYKEQGKHAKAEALLDLFPAEEEKEEEETEEEGEPF